MHNFIVNLFLLFCLYVFDSIAAPTSFTFTSKTSSLTRLQADNVSTVFVSPLPFNLASTNRYPRELSDASDELQPIPNAFFPKYGIVLLILFIMVCALSSALVIITLYSGAARAWISRAPGRLYAWITSERCDEQEVQRDNQSSHHGGSTEKKRCDSPLNIASFNCNPSSPYDISPELTDQTKANSREETMSIPAVTFPVGSVHPPSPSSHKRSPSGSAAHFPQDSAHFCPQSPPFSPLLDHLQALLSTTKRVFQSLTADLTSRSSTPPPPSPNITVAVDICRPTPTESEVFVSSSPATRTSLNGANVTEVGCDLGCQDISSIPASVVIATMSTQQSPFPYTTTHSSPSINSRSGLYSLSGDTPLSASTAYHSFIDLSVLATPSDTHSDTIPVSDPSDDVEAVISLLSPRYMHGLQLETIHEESDGQITSLASTPSAAVVQNNTRSKLLSTSDIKESHATVSYSCRNPRVHRIDPKNSGRSQCDSAPIIENMPSSWAELSHETFTPRFFPAARLPPPRSDPPSPSIPQVVSALRSPERQDKRRSVAWLQPVIDWAVDHPRDDCEYKAGSLDDLEEIPDMENDAECAAALHSADAMAAVMDSLGAIGLDPTDMGLVTGEAISSSLSNSSFHATSPSLPFVDPEYFRSKLHARAVTADSDLIEEKEVENEIGGLSGYITPRKSHQLDVSNLNGYGKNSETQYNRSLYQDQHQGESIKTALMSFLAPSSSHPNPSQSQAEARSKLPDNSATLSQASESERKTPRRDSGREERHIKSVCIHDLIVESREGTGRALSPTNPRPITRTSRAVQADRVYASPSSLAGLSPLEVAKKFSAPSVSSAGSTPSPSGNYAASPPRRPTSVSPLQLRKVKGLSTSPSFDCTASTLTSSPRREPVSPSPRSRAPVSSRQRWQQEGHPAMGSTKSTPMLSLAHDTGFLPQCSSSPISPIQRHKPPAVSALARSAPILIERTNSMDSLTRRRLDRSQNASLNMAV